MRLDTMTTTVAQPVHTLETSPNYTLGQKNTISDTCIITRISNWLWSSRSCDHPDHNNPQSETSVKDVEIRSSSIPCRSCQAWGVECDRQKPHCSHCLDQQICCFYVEPLRVTMKRSRQSKIQKASA
ncbi:hypothetical protein BJX99DRAFT_255628 [Aspergillus californicus]